MRAMSLGPSGTRLHAGAVMVLFGSALTPVAADQGFLRYPLEYLTIAVAVFGALRILLGGYGVWRHVLRSPGVRKGEGE